MQFSKVFGRLARSQKEIRNNLLCGASYFPAENVRRILLQAKHEPPVIGLSRRVQVAALVVQRYIHGGTHPPADSAVACSFESARATRK